MKFSVGKNSTIFMDAWFDTSHNFKIGRNSVINQKCRLDNRGGIFIGDNVSISADVCILTGDHDVKAMDAVGRTRPVFIGDYVFIGTRAMILPGITIGKGAVIAAGAVVTRDVEAFTVVGGIPARIMGQRPIELDYSASYVRLFQ